MGLSKSQRRALAAEALGDDVGDVMNVDEIDPVEPRASVAPVAAPAITLSPDQLQALVTSAVSAAVSAVGASAPTGDFGKQIGDALRDNRQPIPENTDQDYHGRSEYNPEGKAVPRPTLPCEYWFAVWDAKERRASPVREIEPATITNEEIRELSQIAPGAYALEKSDGRPVAVNVVDQLDGFGALLRRHLAFPLEQFSKEHRNELGPLKTFHRRMTPLAPVAA